MSVVPMRCDGAKGMEEPRQVGGPHTVNLNSFAAPEIYYMDEEDFEPKKSDHCWSYIVIKESNPFRIMWSFIIFLMLAYTASAYLYRFSFCFFHIGPDGPSPIGENYLGWVVIDSIVDVCFWIDLVMNFFFSFRNERGCEVDSIKLIACKYLRGFFWVNLIACMPEVIGEVVMWLFTSSNGSDSRRNFRVARLTRLQRMSRLTRLMRLTRLIKCFHVKSRSPFMKWFQSLRGVRIVNFFFGLVWSIHLLACGWYLCAALHADVKETWVARRSINSSGASLLEAHPEEQWLHSMYFVMTVFTTVGFGDISAGTEAEILYVAFTMLVGAVVHSIIISEVIQVVTSTDRISEFVDKQLSLVEAFSEHAQLPWESQSAMKDEIRYRARTWMTSYNFDKDEMKELITGKSIPRWLLGSLPAKMFEGRILRNQFFVGNLYVPPRLPCLLAVHLHQSEFDHGEIVYQMHDFPFNLFLVLSGTFAHVAMPTETGGVDMSCEGMENANLAYTARLKTKKTASTSPKSGILDKWMDKTISHKSEKQRRESSSTGGLYPYRLVGCNNYFGDVEMMRSRPRLTTVRCDSSNASTLILHKTDFTELKDQFPQFGALWMYAARRREWSREKQLARLTIGLPARALAALQLQTAWRTRWRLARSGEAEPRVGHRPDSDDNSADDNPRTLDIQRLARKQFINTTAVKIMDKKDMPGGDGTGEISKRMDKLSEEVACLRDDMRAVLQALNVQPSVASSNGQPLRCGAVSSTRSL